MPYISPAAAAITAAQIRQSYRRRAAEVRQAVAPRIPGVARAGFPRAQDSVRVDRRLADQELAELLALPPGTERTRAYVRLYHRINHLVHVTPTFLES